MSTPFSTSAFNTLTGKLNKLFLEFAKNRMADVKGMQYFDWFKTDWYVYNSLTINALGGAEAAAEGAQLPALTAVEGDSVSVTQQRVGARPIITKDMILFDRTDSMRRLVRTAVDTTFHKIDQSMADLLLRGFTSTSYTDIWGRSQSNTAQDGVVLFSASHTNNLNSDTARNLIRDNSANGNTVNPLLDRAPIVQAMTDAMAHRDPRGVSRPVMLNRLIVGPSNSDLAKRTVYSSGVQGTPNVDYNPLKGGLEVDTWARLDQNGAGTATPLYWFMADSTLVKDSLLAPYAQQPQITAPSTIPSSLNLEYAVDAYYAIKADWPFGIWGSTGAAA
jgi:hypothetical protein